MSPREPLLEVAGLTKRFGGRRRTFGGDEPSLVAVDDVSFDLGAGETLGVVGESGSGKSTLARLVLRLIEPTSGRIRFAGRDITDLQGRALREARQELQAVFQNVAGSLNPKMDLSQLVAEPLKLHRGLGRSERDERAAELLRLVGLRPEHLSRYPYELSGGQRQRVGVARALALQPRLVVMDEPVSALDVSTQSQVVNLLQHLQAELGTAYLFIAHDLYVVHHLSHRIAVMYLEAMVELGSSDQVYSSPRHPYTQALLSAIPDPGADVEGRRERIVLRGEIPSPMDVPSGCRFHTRCPYAFEPCADVVPPLLPMPGGGAVACHLHTAGPVLEGASVNVVPRPSKAQAPAGRSDQIV